MTKLDKRDYFTHTQTDGSRKIYLTNPAICDCGTIHYSGLITHEDDKNLGIFCAECESRLHVKKQVIVYPVIDYREFK